MSFYDVVMLVVLVGAIGFGFWKGVAWQIASVAAIVVSYIVSINFREPVSQFIQAGEPWNKIAAMLILFVGCSLVIWTAYGFVTRSMEKMELRGFDRQIGALVGAVTGAMLCMAITMFSVSLMGDQAHEAIHDSKLGPHIVRGIHQVHGILPEEIAGRFDSYLEHFQEGIGHGLDAAPAGYSPFQQRQADSNGSGVNYQGGWPSTTQGTQAGYTNNGPQNGFQNSGAQYGVQPNPNYQPAYPSSQPNSQYGGATGTLPNNGQARNWKPILPPSTQTQPPAQPQNVWQPPKLEIKVDTESFLKSLFENDK